MCIFNHQMPAMKERSLIFVELDPIPSFYFAQVFGRSHIA